MRRREAAAQLGEARNILVVRLDEIGDVVMTFPLLRELRRNAPDAWIAMVVKPLVADLAETCPHLNQVLTYDRQVKGGYPLLRRHRRAVELARENFWRRRFDIAILPRYDADYYHAIFVAYLSGARRRIGYSELVNEEKSRLNKDYDLLLTDVLDGKGVKHEVLRNLDLLPRLGAEVEDDGLEIHVSQRDAGWAREFLVRRGVNSETMLIALGIGAGLAHKVWPLPRFRDLSCWLIEELGAILLVVGGLAEKPLAEQLHAEFGRAVVQCAGETTLCQTVALMSFCKLYVGNDTGVMHFAAACRVPVVEITCHPASASDGQLTSPVRFGAWGVRAVVVQPPAPCAPCTETCAASTAHCICQVTVEQVREAVSELLGSRMPITRG